MELSRREALAATAIGAAATMAAGAGTARADPRPAEPGTPTDPAGAGWSGPAARRLTPVPARITGGPLAERIEQTRDTYLAVPDEDILHGFRARAGLPAPGRPLGGWAGETSEIVFGQMLSGMARLQFYTGDTEIGAKAVGLYEEWLKTSGADGDLYAVSYGVDKYLVGMVDLYAFAGHDTRDYLAKAVEWAGRTLDRTRPPASNLDWDGREPGGQLEWYTLAENLYRAHELTGEPGYRDFADVWRYDSYWDRFAGTDRPTDLPVVHGYSHVNSFSSAAMAHSVGGEQRYLDIASNAYRYVTGTQMFATGGYGPVERLLPPDGTLGRTLGSHPDSAEVGCGSWAGFKLAQYLQELTGEARYGDWTERLLYNGLGASLPVTTSGETFYYADYRVSGGHKGYFPDAWPCCAGTYVQSVAELHGQVYYRDTRNLYVNLYLPSLATTDFGPRDVTITTETSYPESEEVTIRIATARPVPFGLQLRVPSWCEAPEYQVNDEPRQTGRGRAGEWWSIRRTWTDGDTVRMRQPMTSRTEPVDPQHPNRVALVHGPVVLAQDNRYSTWPTTGSPDALLERLRPGDAPLHLTVSDPPQTHPPTGSYRPFYEMPQHYPYRLYVDLDEPYYYETP